MNLDNETKKRQREEKLTTSKADEEDWEDVDEVKPRKIVKVKRSANQQAAANEELEFEDS
jgi:hypothetical protein